VLVWCVCPAKRKCDVVRWCVSYRMVISWLLTLILCWVVGVGGISHPFPAAWEIPANDNDNFTSVELTSGDEFSFVEEKLHASLPNVTLLCVTRYEIGVA